MRFLAGLVFSALALAALALAAGANRWRTEFPILQHGPVGAFDETAVKDPSIVYAEGKWHLFYTARGRGRYTLGYTAAANLPELTKANHIALSALGMGSAAFAAPQVFYFRPQKLWYLIYQNADSNYQPMYATTRTIGDPDSWSVPRTLVRKGEPDKWIDFWVICDDEKAYLFYTRNHDEVIAMTTELTQFPAGFAHPAKVFSGVHEAVHIYRENKNPKKYAMLFELRGKDESRRYELAEAPGLLGRWNVVPDWTAPASHGELLRTGFDEQMEANVKRARFLIQSLPTGPNQQEYPELPWYLTLIRNY